MLAPFFLFIAPTTLTLRALANRAPSPCEADAVVSSGLPAYVCLWQSVASM